MFHSFRCVVAKGESACRPPFASIVVGVSSALRSCVGCVGEWSEGWGRRAAVPAHTHGRHDAGADADADPLPEPTNLPPLSALCSLPVHPARSSFPSLLAHHGE